MRKGSIKNNNDGFTLIETIISMLILAIIVTPLLRTFVVSAITNNKTKTKQIAGEMAATVMEGVKALGVEETALELNETKELKLVDTSYVTDDTQMYELSYNTLTGIYKRIENQSLLSVYKNDDGVYKFRKNADSRYYYAINNVKKDNRIFDIVVELDATKYTGNVTQNGNANGSVMQNKYKIPELDELNSKTTATLTPTTYDDRAVDYYYDLYKNYEFDKWVKACEVAAANGTATPDYVISKTKDDIKEKISRIHNIVLRRGADNRVTVTCDIIYNFDNTGGIICAVGDENESALSVREYKNAAPEKTYDELENVYLFFSQYNTTDYQKDVIKIDNESAINSVTAANFFIAVQDNNYISPVNVAVDVRSGASDKLNVFSNKQLVSTTGRTYTDSDYSKSLYTRADETDRLYDVTVYVYESDADNRYIRLYTSMTSSIGE